MISFVCEFEDCLEKVVYSFTSTLATLCGVKRIVGDPTLTRDEDISLYITGCKPQPHEPILWG